MHEESNQQKSFELNNPNNKLGKLQVQLRGITDPIKELANLNEDQLPMFWIRYNLVNIPPSISFNRQGLKRKYHFKTTVKKQSIINVHQKSKHIKFKNQTPHQHSILESMLDKGIRNKDIAKKSSFSEKQVSYQKSRKWGEDKNPSLKAINNKRNTKYNEEVRLFVEHLCKNQRETNLTISQRCRRVEQAFPDLGVFPMSTMQQMMKEIGMSQMRKSMKHAPLNKNLVSLQRFMNTVQLARSLDMEYQTIFMDEVIFWASDGKRQGWALKGEVPTTTFKKENLKYSFVVQASMDGLIGIVGQNETVDSEVFCHATTLAVDYVKNLNLHQGHEIQIQSDLSNSHESNLSRLQLTKVLKVRMWAAASKNSETNCCEYAFARVKHLQRKLNTGLKVDMEPNLILSWRLLNQQSVRSLFAYSLVFYLGNLDNVYEQRRQKDLKEELIRQTI